MDGNVGSQFSGVKRVSPKEMKFRRDKNLCQYCSEEYYRGHVSTKQQLYMLMSEDDEKTEIKEEPTKMVLLNKVTSQDQFML